VNEEDQDREEDKGQEEVPICHIHHKRREKMRVREMR
jgi:hypothetical protein